MMRTSLSRCSSLGVKPAALKSMWADAFLSTVTDEKRMCEPSCDQLGPNAPVDMFVKRCASPPPSAMRKIWLFSARPLSNAIHLSSGDHDGSRSLSPRVSCHTRPDATSATQIFDGYVFFGPSILATTYATRAPSCEITADDSSERLKRSSAL